MAAHMHVSNAAGLASLLTGLLFLYATSRCIYNLYFHPLRKFPGPFLHRATRIAWVYRMFRGTLVFDVLRFHDRYGPVVRIAPDELAFLEPEAWQDIYGHRAGNKTELAKPDLFYRPARSAPSIISEDRENHALLRRALAPGFSERSMREQQTIIGGYVDLLIQRLREHCVEQGDGENKQQGRRRRALNMKHWYNFATFDIIGDLAFGEPFGSLQASRYDSWVKVVNDTVPAVAVMFSIRHLGLERLLAPLMYFSQRSRRENMRKTEDKLRRRMALDVERPDFIEGLLRKKDEWNMDFDRLRATSATLIVAGSETTATLLSGATFLLLTNPDALRKVTEEVRSAFKTDEDITLTSVSQLSYMLACLNEALRRYPPVAGGMPRIVGRGGTIIVGYEIPEKTYVACWQYAQYHSSANWTDPFAYKPERFLEGSKDPKDRHDVLNPFSVGPRNCIGRNLAYAEMRLILARILFNFDMELVDPKFNWLDHKAYILWNKPALNVYLTPVQ